MFTIFTANFSLILNKYVQSFSYIVYGISLNLNNSGRQELYRVLVLRGVLPSSPLIIIEC
jgi:hypothetical protein